VQAAIENLALNPWVDRVEFRVADLTGFTARGRPTAGGADVVVANLTGALLVRAAATLGGAVGQAGYLILSGIMDSEGNEVVQAFGEAEITWEASEGEWVGLILRPNPRAPLAV
jgi:ribosomal protein L11 methylase PrmA